MKAVLMAFVMTIRLSSGIRVPFLLSAKHITAFGRYDGSTAPCGSMAVVGAETDRYRFCYRWLPPAVGYARPLVV
jgi:hypothetical protein